MPKPTEYPDWAMQDSVDSVSELNNVIEPGTEQKDFGWTRNEIPPRQWFNWLARKTSEWIRYLDEFTEGIAAVETYTSTNTDDITDVSFLFNANLKNVDGYELKLRKMSNGYVYGSLYIDAEKDVANADFGIDNIPAEFLPASGTLSGPVYGALFTSPAFNGFLSFYIANQGMLFTHPELLEIPNDGYVIVGTASPAISAEFVYFLED